MLASEALQREMAPAQPGAALARWGALALGVGGCGGLLFLDTAHGIGVPLSAMFALVALLGLVPIPYSARAGGLTVISATALALVTYRRVATSADPTPILLVLSVAVLGAGLLLRGWHRGSFVARLLVLVGIIQGALWLGVTGALTHFSTLDSNVLRWLPNMLHVPFALLLMLSLLAFMDARTTAGAGIWAALVLAWYATHIALDTFTQVWEADVQRTDPRLLAEDPQLMQLSCPLLTALLVIGLAQLLAETFSKTRRRVYNELPV